MNCNEVAEEELKRLRDIQRLLQNLNRLLGSQVENLGLEEIL